MSAGIDTLLSEVVFKLNTLTKRPWITEKEMRENVPLLFTSMHSLCDTDEEGACTTESGFICDPAQPPGVCLPVREEGWYILKFLAALFFLFHHTQRITHDSELAAFLQKEILGLEQAMRLEVSLFLKEAPKFLGILRTKTSALGAGESFFLEIGAADHTIYLEFSKDTGNRLTAIIYESAGFLKTQHTDPRYVFPLLIDLTTSPTKCDKFEEVISRILMLRKNGESIESLDWLRCLSELSALQHICSVVSDYVQPNDNCSWRAYSLLLKQHCAIFGIDHKEMFNCLRAASLQLLSAVDIDENRVIYAARAAAERGVAPSIDPLYEVPIRKIF